MKPHLNFVVNTHKLMFAISTNVCVLDTAEAQMQLSFMRDEEIYEQLGRQIAARRRELKMAQRELATAVGMSRASIANIECGRQNVLLHHLYRFAEALNMSNVADLLPIPVISGKLSTEFLGMPFSDENISQQTKVLMSELVSNALLHRKSKS